MKTILFSLKAFRHGVLSMFTETLHDKSGSFCYSALASITELSDWHIKIIRLCFDSEELFYQYCLSLPDVTPYEALILAEKVFPEPQSETFLYIDDDGEERLNDISPLRS